MPWISRKFSGSLPTAAAVIFTGILGVYANRWTAEILDAFDDVAWSRPPAWHAIGFFVGTGLLALLALLNVLAGSYERRQETARRDAADAREAEFERRLALAVSRLEEADRERRIAIDRLQVMMQTLPDERFLQKFQEIYKEVASVVEAALAGAPYAPEDAKYLERAIRAVLNGIASLAQAFDGWDGDSFGAGSVQVVYGANVMVYYPASTYSEADIAEIRPRLKFAEDDLDPRALAGVLELRRELSTSTDLEGYEPDPGLRDLALSIPKNPNGEGGRSRLQPGAPDAFVSQVLQRIPSGDEFLRRLEERDLSPTVKARIREHFTERAELRVRSFISVPLVHPEVGSGPLGVLNVHRSRPNILRDTNPETLFAPVVIPLLHNLTQLVHRLLEVEAIGESPTPASTDSSSLSPQQVDDQKSSGVGAAPSFQEGAGLPFAGQ